jgi:hypothetical protein
MVALSLGTEVKTQHVRGVGAIRLTQDILSESGTPESLGRIDRNEAFFAHCSVFFASLCFFASRKQFVLGPWELLSPLFLEISFGLFRRISIFFCFGAARRGRRIPFSVITAME